MVSGGFAVVKQATNMITGKKVAIKIMDKTKFTSSQLDLIKAEVKLMDLVKGHPNGISYFIIYLLYDIGS
jgi:serine/threonine protein kinase